MGNIFSNDPIKNILIDENVKFEDLIQNTFIFYLEGIQSSHKLLSQSYDPENLHKLRVSLRKFKSFLSFIKNFMPKKEWKYANTLYKSLIKPTSKARDYDVFKSEYLYPPHSQNQKESEFQNIYKIFDKKQNNVHEYIEDCITSNHYMSYLNKLQTWIVDSDWKDKPIKQYKCRGKKLINLINKMVRKKYKNILKNKKRALNFDQKELHRYRIDIKELRYTIETLRPYIEHGKKEAEFLKNMQEILGKINDTYTAENVAQNLNPNNSKNLYEPYLTKYAIDKRYRCLTQLQNIK